jgi:glycosyltransferase involved in cell wall biosynthesis
MSSISVIIPVFNRADLIGQTLHSLLCQTLPADEIIVVDDGSSDGTPETVLTMLKWGKADKLKFSNGQPWPEIKVIRQPNAGPGAARNRGLAEARGEFIHFFDSDDLAASNKHEVQQKALEGDSDIAVGPWVKGQILSVETLAFGNAEKLKEKGKPQVQTLPCSDFAVQGPWSFAQKDNVIQHYGLPQGDLIKALVTRWAIVPQTCMFRRSILEKSGGFPPHMFAAEDQVLFLRCLMHGARVVHTPETLTFYRLGNQGKLTESTEGHRRRIRDWARYLIIADEELCSIQYASLSASQRPKDPSCWFGFRQRCWSALRDLNAAGDGSSDEAHKLRELTYASLPELAYATVAILQRWRGGLQARLTGSREDASFRTGMMTCEQKSLFPGNYKT